VCAEGFQGHREIRDYDIHLTVDVKLFQRFEEIAVEEPDPVRHLMLSRILPGYVKRLL